VIHPPGGRPGEFGVRPGENVDRSPHVAGQNRLNLPCSRGRAVERNRYHRTGLELWANEIFSRSCDSSTVTRRNLTFVSCWPAIPQSPSAGRSVTYTCAADGGRSRMRPLSLRRCSPHGDQRTPGWEVKVRVVVIRPDRPRFPLNDRHHQLSGRTVPAHSERTIHSTCGSVTHLHRACAASSQESYRSPSIADTNSNADPNCFLTGKCACDFH